MNPRKCGWYGDPGCRPKYKADLFPHTPVYDLFPCTADIQAIVSFHVETVVLLSQSEVGKNYNLPKSEDAKQPQCPPEKEKAIMEALKHFGMLH